MTKIINDEFSDLDITPQKRWCLRHPKERKKIQQDANKRHWKELKLLSREQRQEIYVQTSKKAQLKYAQAHPKRMQLLITKNTRLVNGWGLSGLRGKLATESEKLAASILQKSNFHNVTLLTSIMPHCPFDISAFNPSNTLCLIDVTTHFKKKVGAHFLLAKALRAKFYTLFINQITKKSYLMEVIENRKWLRVPWKAMEEMIQIG
jgi:hypothetical protein